MQKRECLLIHGPLLFTNLAPLLDHHNGAKSNNSNNRSGEPDLIFTAHGD